MTWAHMEKWVTRSWQGMNCPATKLMNKQIGKVWVAGKPIPSCSHFSVPWIFHVCPTNLTPRTFDTSIGAFWHSLGFKKRSFWQQPGCNIQDSQMGKWLRFYQVFCCWPVGISIYFIHSWWLCNRTKNPEGLRGCYSSARNIFSLGSLLDRSTFFNTSFR